MHDFIHYLLHLLQRGMKLAIPAALLCVLVLGVAWLWFRARKRPFPWGKAVVLVMLVGWAALTIFATMLRGEGGTYREWNFQLFLAWREAWNRFTLQIWLNVLLNIALFVPLGLLLPLLAKVFRRWYAMLAAGFVTSLAIELMQLVTKRGMFDVDDLFTNTLGAMLGWGVTAAILSLVHRERGWGRRCLGGLSVPIAFALAMAVLFGSYVLKPYGNLPESAVSKGDLSNVQWKLDFTPAESPVTAPVYQAGRMDKTSSDGFAQEFAKSLGIEFEDIVYYDDLNLYCNHSTGDFLHVRPRDGTWEYSVGNNFPALASAPDEVSREELAAVLSPIGIVIPEGAEMTVEPFGEEMTKVIFTVEQAQAGDQLIHGTLTCTLTQEEGKTQLYSVENMLVKLTPAREEEILSPAQAIQKLYDGKSACGMMLEYEGGDHIEVLDCWLDWSADTKGFYQPVYQLKLRLESGHEYQDMVPALR